MPTRRDAQAQEVTAPSKGHRSAQGSQAPQTEPSQPRVAPSARGGLPRHARSSDILSLQRTVGNRAVQRMIQRKGGGPGAPPAPADISAIVTQAVTVALQQVPQLKAHAFAQGTDIPIAAGQEQHLPHEEWHTTQQKPGKVQPTVQLEREDEQ